ncbi:MAG: bifunctional riboflavin kinase/FAD synthetase [Sphingomonadaceae bacterium]
MSPQAEVATPEAVATIGVFDGVHLGHQALIRRVVERAGQLGMVSVCVTFSPHPEDVLRPDSGIAHLAGVEDRLATIKGLGVSEVVVMEFTSALAALSPEEFIDRLMQRFRLRELWIGSDFALGRGRTGTPERLAAIGREKGFVVRSLPPVEVDGQVVSSSRIRQLLADGQVEEAARLLGRAYRLRGRVVAGDGRGRSLGFATANLAPDDRLCVPGDGVYAVAVQVEGGGEWHGVANVGVRPTFGESARQIEIHLLGFSGDLYGKRLAVDFVARLRGERRFESVEALKAQIAEDVRKARSILGESPPHSASARSVAPFP